MSSSKISIRLFVGCLATPNIKRELHVSPIWKQKKADTILGNSLIDVSHHSKDYIGKYLNFSLITLKEFKRQEEEIHQTLISYCPNLNREMIQIVIFPQIFVG